MAPATLEDRIEADPNYQMLKSKRTRLGWTLTLAMMVVYYGFILLVATNKPLLSIKLGSATLGIVLGVAVILMAWAITATYVIWANRHYDPEVARLRDLLR